jgi:hypothetical protein
MHYLERNHLIPNVRLHIDEVALSNATITVSLPDFDGQKVAVGLPTAELVLVREK